MQVSPLVCSSLPPVISASHPADCVLLPERAKPEVAVIVPPVILKEAFFTLEPFDEGSLMSVTPKLPLRDALSATVKEAPWTFTAVLPFTEALPEIVASPPVISTAIFRPIIFPPVIWRFPAEFLITLWLSAPAWVRSILASPTPWIVRLAPLPTTINFPALYVSEALIWWLPRSNTTFSFISETCLSELSKTTSFKISMVVLLVASTALNASLRLR